jgi:galactose mutarotase-like enzyme
MQFTLTSHGASATLDTFGGELTGYRLNGIEYVWYGDPKYWPGRAPVLFPVVCSLKNGIVSIYGKEYEMPKHGFARKRDFILAERTADSVTFLLKADAESLPMYPFRFRLEITHSLYENGFSTTYSVTNEDKQEMPFCIGGHAGFNCPLREGESFEDYELILGEKEEIPALYTNAQGLFTRDDAVPLIQDGHKIPLRYKDFDRDSFTLDGLRSRDVQLVHRQTKKGLLFSFDGFYALGVWTPPQKNAPFICLEPWAGLPAEAEETGNFMDKPYVQVLKSGMTKTFQYRMTALE